MTEPYALRRALAHVGGFASGAALDPTLRVTVNVRPDRLVAETIGSSRPSSGCGTTSRASVP